MLFMTYKHTCIFFNTVFRMIRYMQPITLSLDKSNILRNSWRFQKDNRAIKCGCNKNNFMLNIRNYSNFVFVSIIHTGIKAISIEGINFIKKGYFKIIHRTITLKKLLSLEGRHGWL